MKNTIITIAITITFMLTWCFFAFIDWCLTESTYKMCMTDQGVLLCLIVIGWVPSIMIGGDLDELIK